MSKGQFEEINIPDSNNPMELWEAWFKEAQTCSLNRLPQTMTVSTVNAAGCPTSRSLLLKGYDDKGFRICTFYDSPKANDLETNPNIALVFLWYFQGPGESEVVRTKQVRIEGLAYKLTAEQNDDYFQNDPLYVQIRAVVDYKSKVMNIKRKEDLLKIIEDIHTKAESDPNFKLQRPVTCGGYIIQPHMMEFYQSAPFNVAARYRFTRSPPVISNSDTDSDNILVSQWKLQDLLLGL